MERERYTHMQHNIRKHFKLSMEEYAVLDAIYCLSRSQACDAHPPYFVELFDISRRTYFNILKSLTEKNLIEKVKHGVKTTQVWDDAMAGRVAPWVDPSEKKPEKSVETPIVEAPETPSEPVKDNDKSAENCNNAEFALCENCLKIVQILHSEEIESAEFALKLCKICTEAVQKLHSTGAKFALHNIDINTVINNDNNNIKDLEPARLSAFNEIDKLFRVGSEKLTGQIYYKDGKEAKQIKLLEPRYTDNPEAFVNLTRKYYYMISKVEDSFWHGQPFTPSAFNSLYNRIQSYQLPEGSRKREEQKQKSDSDILMQNYGNFNRGELEFLLANKTINKEQFEIIIKSKPLEVSA